jgi:hypothetical protein
MTLTGASLPQYPGTIEARKAELEAVYKKVFGTDKKPTQQDLPAPSKKISLPYLMKKASEQSWWGKFNTLWSGNWSAYKKTKQNQSAADLALCGFLAALVGPNPEEIDRLFRHSGLMRPKWEREDYRTATINKACESPAAVKDDVPKIEIVRITSKDLAAKQLPPTKWVIKDLLPEGHCILAGPPKSGKSIASFNLAIGVSCGSKIFGYFPVVKNGAVIYLALEDTQRSLKARQERMLCGQPAPDNLHLITQFPGMHFNGLKYLEKMMVETPDLMLVIIDTLARFRPPKPNNKALYDHDYETGVEIKALADKYNVTVLTDHHSRKNRNEDTIDDVSGSYGVTGAADTIWMLRRQGTKAEGELHVIGREVEREEYALAFDGPLLAWRVTGRVTDIMGNQNKQMVYNTLRHSEDPMTPKQITAACGLNYDHVKKILERLHKEKEIKKAGYGKYTTTTIMDA